MKFEYQVIALKTFEKLKPKNVIEDERILNLFGENGWRIVAHSQLNVIFMRRIGKWERIKKWLKRT